MSAVPAVGELNTEGFEGEQLEALEDLHEALLVFKVAFEGIVAVGIKPTDALQACGYNVPLFARPMVNSVLTA